MARPLAVAASNMEGTCEYVEKAVADSRQGVIVELGG